MRRHIDAIGVVLALGALLSAGLRAEQVEYHLMIKNHRFEPLGTRLPAGQKVQLIVDNQDLSAEKFIPGHGRARLWVGLLSPGKHPLSGEFHPLWQLPSEDDARAVAGEVTDNHFGVIEHDGFCDNRLSRGA